MPIEIKGIKDKARKARANLDALGTAYDKFNEMAPAHAADVDSLTTQVGSMQSDLEFATNTMGNSTGKSDEEEADKTKAGLNGSFPKPGAGDSAG